MGFIRRRARSWREHSNRHCWFGQSDRTVRSAATENAIALAFTPNTAISPSPDFDLDTLRMISDIYPDCPASTVPLNSYYAESLPGDRTAFSDRRIAAPRSIAGEHLGLHTFVCTEYDSALPYAAWQSSLDGEIS